MNQPSGRVNRRLEGVNVASLRVALMASGIFAVVYTIVAAIIVFLVTNNLQAQIDTRLTSSLSDVQAGSGLDPRLVYGPRGGQIGSPQLFAWVVNSNGGVVWTNSNLGSLPPSILSVSHPVTQTLGNDGVRVDSAPLSDGRVVLAESLDSVSQTRDTIAVTELAVGLVLLAVAFVGALVGGRRVGAPIELARQRQMEFTADASHELRTPLSVIEAQTSLALSQERDAEWYRSAFTRVGRESKRIRRLVEDLLWLARVDSSAAEEHAEPVEVGVLAAQAVDRFTAVAESRGIAIGLHVGRGPHMVTGSPEWLDRLLGVLIDNACKYAPEQGRVRVSVMNDGNRVRVQVEDSGPGIPTGERGRIFERFHRATTDKPGAGLGLAIADAVVRRTHGRWEVGTSAELGGASVGVSWPRTGSAPREAARGGSSAPARGGFGAAPPPAAPPQGVAAPSPPPA